MSTLTISPPTNLNLPRNGYHTPRVSLPAQRISLATYWETYYHDLDHTYEYNNGLLEEKPMARQIHADMFMWFSSLLRRYFEAHPIGKMSSLEIGFTMRLPHKQVRRPDLAIVLDSNPMPFDPSDMKYSGIFDVCVEAVSDSSRKEIERDVVTKFKEYEAAGVKEYWLLSDDPQILGFYRLNTQGRYQAVPLTSDGVWVSQVLPDFQVRRSDLLDMPAHDSLVDDPVYASYISPSYQVASQQLEQERQRAEQERQRAEQERQRAEQVAQQLEQERQRAELVAQQLEQERQRAGQEQLVKKKLMEALRQQGLDPETFLR